MKLGESDLSELKRLFKGAVIRAIINKREERKGGSSQLALMVPKLKKVIACEEAENYELAEKVMKGIVPLHHVTDDGNLISAALVEGDVPSLSSTHPIMKIFK